VGTIIKTRIRHRFSVLLSRSRARKVLPYVHGRVLDVGCGVGTIIEFLPRDTDYVGVDSVRNVVEKLLSIYPRVSAHVLDIQREVLSCREPFDAILAIALIEHLKRPLDFLDLYLPLLAPGGKIVVTTPTRLGDRVHHMLQVVGITDPGVSDVHHHIYRLHELVDLLEGRGLEVVASRRFQMGMNQIAVGRK